MGEPRWLSDDEHRAWVPIASLVLYLPAHLEEALAAHKLSFFEYTSLVVLSNQSDRTLTMKTLAHLARGSLSRMSHAARRLERRGLVQRRRSADDGRVTLVTLTDDGFNVLAGAAPDHVESVRHAIFDVLSADEAATFADYSLRINEKLNPGEPPWDPGK